MCLNGVYLLISAEQETCISYSENNNIKINHGRTRLPVVNSRINISQSQLSVIYPCIISLAGSQGS